MLRVWHSIAPWSLSNAFKGGAFGIFEAHMRPPRELLRGVFLADVQLQSAGFHSYLVARCHVQNWWRLIGLNTARAMGGFVGVGWAVWCGVLIGGKTVFCATAFKLGLKVAGPGPELLVLV